MPPDTPPTTPAANPAPQGNQTPEQPPAQPPAVPQPPAQQEPPQANRSQGNQPPAQPEQGHLDEKIAATVAAVLKQYGLQPRQEEPTATPAELALKERLAADLEKLSEPDRKMVLTIAGDDIVQQSRIYTALLQAGKISATAPPTEGGEGGGGTSQPPTAPAQPAAPPLTRIDMNPAGDTHPDDWKSADAAVARAVRDLRL